MQLLEIMIAVQKEANGLEITRENYSQLAERVIPDNGISYRRVQNAKRDDFPEEYDAYMEALAMRTIDWLDMACRTVAWNQLKQAVKNQMEQTT